MARLHEYQGKALLAQKGIPIPQGGAASTASEAREIAAEIGGPVVVKIQAWVTGRAGLGGICFAETPDETAQAAADMLGMQVGGFTVEQVMAMMQESGVAAGVVETSPDLYEDPQLKHRQHYLELEHPVLGRHKYDTPPFKLSKTPAELHMPAPCIGQHNEYFYTKILGMSDQEFVELDNEGVFK